MSTNSDSKNSIFCINIYYFSWRHPSVWQNIFLLVPWKKQLSAAILLQNQVIFSLHSIFRRTTRFHFLHINFVSIRNETIAFTFEFQLYSMFNLLFYSRILVRAIENRLRRNSVLRMYCSSRLQKIVSIITMKTKIAGLAFVLFHFSACRNVSTAGPSMELKCSGITVRPMGVNLLVVLSLCTFDSSL